LTTEGVQELIADLQLPHLIPDIELVHGMDILEVTRGVGFEAHFYNIRYKALLRGPLLFCVVIASILARLLYALSLFGHASL